MILVSTADGRTRAVASDRDAASIPLDAVRSVSIVEGGARLDVPTPRGLRAPVRDRYVEDDGVTVAYVVEVAPSRSSALRLTVYPERRTRLDLIG